MNRRRRLPRSEPRPAPAVPTVYQVRVRGHLDDRSADWQDGLTVTREGSGDSLLTVRIVDQAALHGLLRKLRDLGVPLVSINQVPSRRIETPAAGTDGPQERPCDRSSSPRTRRLRPSHCAQEDV